MNTTEETVTGARQGAESPTYLTLVPVHDLVARGYDLDTPDSRHQAVMSLFGELAGVPRRDAQILFRLERLPAKAPALLVQSLEEPAYPTEEMQARSFAMSEFPVGCAVAFRLAVNAVQRPKQGGIRPVGFADDPNAEVRIDEWLAQKLAPGLEEVTVLNHIREVVGVDRQGRVIRRGHKVIQVDTVDGVARVADPAALLRQMAEGVGRAKAYGCGLLTVKAV